eukprot:GHVS01025890.1.p1 GENE.GHVS01025890.1~~GHVS01025890.1.p1  ORF type:complete len:334 (-),score=32.03 GHVS01025890.1:361-1362(-)
MGGLWLLVAFLLGAQQVASQFVTEIYETCTAIEGQIARCGPGANCFIMGGLPSCQCIIDIATGLPLAGNPYKACTWDMSGTWQLFSYIDHKTGFYKDILSPISNEPFVIRMDRTDALLKTNYMMGAIFIVTALTAFSMGVCSRAFLDANDNTSVILEQAEGFLDQNGRSLLLRTNLLDTTVTKIYPKKTGLKDRFDLKGEWQKNDGSHVDIKDLKKPHKWPNFYTDMTKNWAAYWYNDASYGAPLVRLSMALFLDKTRKEEKMAFNTNARFVQIGWYGSLIFGTNRINIYSPADGNPIFTLLKVDTLPPFTPVGSTAANLQRIQTMQVDAENL